MIYEIKKIFAKYTPKKYKCYEHLFGFEGQKGTRKIRVGGWMLRQEDFNNSTIKELCKWKLIIMVWNIN